MIAGPLAVTGAGVVAPPVSGEELERRLTSHQARRLDRLSQLIVAASTQAAEQARLRGAARDRVGIVVGTGLGCLQKTGDYLDGIVARGAGHADALTFPDTVDNAPAAHVGVTLGCRGPSMTVTGREICGECAVILAALLLRQGQAEAVVVAAGDSAVQHHIEALRRIDPRITPEEGAAALVLEPAGLAKLRGVPEIGRLLGFAQASAPLPRPHLRFASEEVVERARKTALAMAFPGGKAPAGLDFQPPRAAGAGYGWTMADGILRSVRALERLSRGEGSAALIGRAARGGTAAALVFGPGRPEARPLSRAASPGARGDA